MCVGAGCESFGGLWGGSKACFFLKSGTRSLVVDKHERKQRKHDRIGGWQEKTRAGKEIHSRSKKDRAFLFCASLFAASLLSLSSLFAKFHDRRTDIPLASWIKERIQGRRRKNGVHRIQRPPQHCISLLPPRVCATWHVKPCPAEWAPESPKQRW